MRNTYKSNLRMEKKDSWGAVIVVDTRFSTPKLALFWATMDMGTGMKKLAILLERKCLGLERFKRVSDVQNI